MDFAIYNTVMPIVVRGYGRNNMDDLEKKIINTQNEYFELLQESYGDLIRIYENEGTTVAEAVDKYMQRYSLLYEHKSYLLIKRALFRKQVTAFWKTHRDDLINFVKKNWD